MSQYHEYKAFIIARAGKYHLSPDKIQANPDIIVPYMLTPHYKAWYGNPPNFRPEIDRLTNFFRGPQRNLEGTRYLTELIIPDSPEWNGYKHNITLHFDNNPVVSSDFMRRRDAYSRPRCLLPLYNLRYETPPVFVGNEIFIPSSIRLLNELTRVRIVDEKETFFTIYQGKYFQD